MTHAQELHECIACKHLYQSAPTACDCCENKDNIYRKWIALPADELEALKAREPMTDEQRQQAFDKSGLSGLHWEGYVQGVEDSEAHHNITSKE